MGKFREIIWRTLSMRHETEDYCQRRDLAEEYLLKARRYVYPELFGIGHSYGIGHDKVADFAYDMHQATRSHLGKYVESFSYYQIPKLIAKKDGFIFYLDEEHLNVLADAAWYYYRICNGYFEDVIKICAVEKMKPALDYLNMAKEQVITDKTDPADDALELYKIVKELQA